MELWATEESLPRLSLTYSMSEASPQAPHLLMTPLQDSLAHLATHTSASGLDSKQSLNSATANV